MIVNVKEALSQQYMEDFGACDEKECLRGWLTGRVKRLEEARGEAV